MSSNPCSLFLHQKLVWQSQTNCPEPSELKIQLCVEFQAVLTSPSGRGGLWKPSNEGRRKFDDFVDADRGMPADAGSLIAGNVFSLSDYQSGSCNLNFTRNLNSNQTVGKYRSRCSIRRVHSPLYWNKYELLGRGEQFELNRHTNRQTHNLYHRLMLLYLE